MHLSNCDSCRVASQRPLTPLTLGALARPAPSDVCEVECFVDRVVIGNDLTFLSHETLLRMPFQSQIRQDGGRSALNAISRPGLNLRRSIIA